MRFAACIFSAFLALAAALPAPAQGLSAEAEEFKRMAGELADLREANLAQQKRISALQREIEQLRESVRESSERSITKMGDFVTREDLKKIVDQIREVDSRREADRKLILQEFESLGKTMAQAAKNSKRRDPEPDNKPEAKPAEPEKPYEGLVIEYTVEPNESLSGILQKYNADLQRRGLPSVSMKTIQQANPGLNPNRIFAGQKLQLPVPEKK